jgi:hypothetical protein
MSEEPPVVVAAVLGGAAKLVDTDCRGEVWLVVDGAAGLKVCGRVDVAWGPKDGGGDVVACGPNEGGAGGEPYWPLYTPGAEGGLPYAWGCCWGV